MAIEPRKTSPAGEGSESAALPPGTSSTVSLLDLSREDLSVLSKSLADESSDLRKALDNAAREAREEALEPSPDDADPE